MTLEEALKRIQFLEKALDGAIDLAKIKQFCYDGKSVEALCTSHYCEGCYFEDEPELATFILEKKK